MIRISEVSNSTVYKIKQWDSAEWAQMPTLVNKC